MTRHHRHRRPARANAIRLGLLLVAVLLPGPCEPPRALLSAPAGGPAGGPAEEDGRGGAERIDEERLEAHIARLREWLIAAQGPGGFWTDGEHPIGNTALAVLALKHAGLPDDHPAIREGVGYLDRHQEPETYSESLVICALEKVDAEAHRPRIQKSLRFLCRSQSRTGSWSYSGRSTTFDNSNTQFAVLGIAAAKRCGLPVPPQVERRSRDHWLRTQNPDGGWCYGTRGGGSYLSMTCAGIASLHLLGRRHETPGARCGEYEYDRVLERGLTAMVGQVRSDAGLSHFGFGSGYALYALERVGMFLDLKEIGGVDWYRWGATRILSADGVGSSIADVAFRLLFLAKGNARIAIAKWRWNGDWNNDHGDVRRWVARASAELEKKLDWIPARLDDPDGPAARASMIFVNGHGRLNATDGELAFLREFLRRGGTLVGEGCCGSGEFADSFRGLVKRGLYPDQPVRFVEIGPAHPVCRQKHTLTPEEISGQQAKIGCRRRRVLLLTRDISCALGGEPCSESESERAERVAVNVLAWAMRFRAPRSKLASVDLAGEATGAAAPAFEEMELEPGDSTRRYRQPIGRLIHRGEWDVDPRLFPTLRRALARADDAPFCDGEVFVNPRSEDLHGCAVIYVTGHDAPGLRPEEWRPLQTYVQNGGTILACACCGSRKFDTGLRRLLSDMLPNDSLETIPGSDPVWNIARPRATLRVHATEAYREQHASGLAPLLGVRRGGRWVVIYSPVDLCCDLDGDLVEEIVAYRKATALPIWTNLLTYVFTP